MIRKAAIAILLVLLALVIIQKMPDETLQTLPELPKVQVSKVSTFALIQHGQEMLKAVRNGELWLLDGDTQKPMNASLVDRFLHDLEQMRPKRIASRKVDHHHRFEVADAGVQVQLFEASRKVLDVWVGKTATDLRSTYIRLEGSEVVLTVDKVLTWQVKRTKEAWLKKGEEVEQQ